MTPTREQLELAAKAAGYEHCKTYLIPPNFAADGILIKRGEGGYRWWNPIASKSDSFDLEVDCEIEPMFHDTAVSALSGSDFHTAPVYWLDHDKGLATMWAVFLCAVEIGRSL